jgi:hypothetical protein
MKIWKVKYEGRCRKNFLSSQHPPKFDRTVILLLNDKSTEKTAQKEALHFIQQQGPEWFFEECKDEKPYIRDITKQKLLALY